MLIYPTLLLSVKSPSVLHKTIHIDKACWQCITRRSVVFGAVLRKSPGFHSTALLCMCTADQEVSWTLWQLLQNHPEFQVHTDPL